MATAAVLQSKAAGRSWCSPDTCSSEQGRDGGGKGERTLGSSSATALQQTAAQVTLQLPRVFPFLLFFSSWKHPFMFN